ncbi:MAG TPA: hypothetical protein VF188_13100 [Longimicrobiales bacterium]
MFLERIPWHFATDEYSWGNQMLRGMGEKLGEPRLEQCAREARDFSLLLIRVEQSGEVIRALERLLIARLDPAFNRRKPRIRQVMDHLSVREAVEALV